jgi:Ser/Thr protein kinase RdoA (MazF antagonist)
LAGETFHAAVFREAPGVEFGALDLSARRPFLRLAGRTMGSLHRLARAFPRPPEFARWHWTDDRWARFPSVVPDSEREAWRLYEELQAWTNGLARDGAVFGLIHGDFTILNLRILPDRVTLFDFDSCGEHWYGYEIATFLHYFGPEASAREEIYEEVLTGYAGAHPLEARTVETIPLFGKMRLLYSYLVFAEVWGFEGLSPEQEAYFALRRRLFEAAPVWPRERKGRPDA